MPDERIDIQATAPLVFVEGIVFQIDRDIIVQPSLKIPCQPIPVHYRLRAVFPLLLEIVELIVDFFLRQSVYNFAQAFSVLVESERQSVSLPVRLGRHRLAYPPVTQLNCNGLPEVFDVDVDLPDSASVPGSQRDREVWVTRLIRTGRVSIVISAARVIQIS